MANCLVCGNTKEEEKWVCASCGTVREDPAELEDQRRALRELHYLLGQASASTISEEGERRETIWKNAFYPTDATLLMEEVLWCRERFELEAAIRRAEGALTRLELLAVSVPELQKKLPVLRQLVESKRKGDRREILYVILGISFLLGGFIWVVSWIVGKIFPAGPLEAPPARGAIVESGTHLVQGGIGVTPPASA